MSRRIRPRGQSRKTVLVYRQRGVPRSTPYRVGIYTKRDSMRHPLSSWGGFIKYLPNREYKRSWLFVIFSTLPSVCVHTRGSGGHRSCVNISDLLILSSMFWLPLKKRCLRNAHVFYKRKKKECAVLASPGQPPHSKVMQTRGQ